MIRVKFPYDHLRITCNGTTHDIEIDHDYSDVLYSQDMTLRDIMVRTVQRKIDTMSMDRKREIVRMWNTVNGKAKPILNEEAVMKNVYETVIVETVMSVHLDRDVVWYGDERDDWRSQKIGFDEFYRLFHILVAKDLRWYKDNFIVNCVHEGEARVLHRMMYPPTASSLREYQQNYIDEYFRLLRMKALVTDPDRRVKLYRRVAEAAGVVGAASGDPDFSALLRGVDDRMRLKLTNMIDEEEYLVRVYAYLKTSNPEDPRPRIARENEQMQKMEMKTEIEELAPAIRQKLVEQRKQVLIKEAVVGKPLEEFKAEKRKEILNYHGMPAFENLNIDQKLFVNFELQRFMDERIPQMRDYWETYYTTNIRNGRGVMTEVRTDRLQAEIAKMQVAASEFVGLSSVMNRMETNKLLFGEYWVTPDTFNAPLSPRQRDKINDVRRSKGEKYAKMLRGMYREDYISQKLKVFSLETSFKNQLEFHRGIGSVSELDFKSGYFHDMDTSLFLHEKVTATFSPIWMRPGAERTAYVVEVRKRGYEIEFVTTDEDANAFQEWSDREQANIDTWFEKECRLEFGVNRQNQISYANVVEIAQGGGPDSAKAATILEKRAKKEQVLSKTWDDALETQEWRRNLKVGDIRDTAFEWVEKMEQDKRRRRREQELRDETTRQRIRRFQENLAVDIAVREETTRATPEKPVAETTMSVAPVTYSFMKQLRPVREKQSRRRTRMSKGKVTVKRGEYFLVQSRASSDFVPNPDPNTRLEYRTPKPLIEKNTAMFKHLPGTIGITTGIGSAVYGIEEIMREVEWARRAMCPSESAAFQTASFTHTRLIRGLNWFYLNQDFSGWSDLLECRLQIMTHESGVCVVNVNPLEEPFLLRVNSIKMEKNKKGKYEPLLNVSFYSRITTMDMSSDEEKYDVVSSSGVIFYLNLPDVSTALFDAIVKEMVSTMGPIKEYLQRQEKLEQAQRERKRDILRRIGEPLRLGLGPTVEDSDVELDMSDSEDSVDFDLDDSDSWISD